MKLGIDRYCVIPWSPLGSGIHLNPPPYTPDSPEWNTNGLTCSMLDMEGGVRRIGLCDKMICSVVVGLHV